MNDRIVITIDGLAGSGKSTLSALLAQRLGFIHLYSGGLYRAVGMLALRHGIPFHDEAALVEMMKTHSIEFIANARGSSEVLLDRAQIGSEMHTPQVSEATSATSLHAGVRARLIELQRSAFAGRGLVAEGRDMGTVVFPEAPLKMFITASEETRVKRRLAQLQKASADAQAEDDNALKRKLEIEVIERDKRDAGRRVSPTKPADDAVIIDNSDRTLTEVVETMYSHVRSRGLVN